jgi:phosphoribosylformylglycinamidine synthase subunit PurL
VICGPGENAGVVDIGDGQALVFKMESHNHPSYIEPIRARRPAWAASCATSSPWARGPIAAMNALSFGAPDAPATAHLVKGVVEGIGGYGNCFGVPNVGGEVRFHRPTTATAWSTPLPPAWPMPTSDLLFSRPRAWACRCLSGRQDRARRGRRRDHGLGRVRRPIEEKRPTVQVGDPFTEKRLLEACLELMASGAVISIQDMGAAGLTCSAVEMGDKGGWASGSTSTACPAAKGMTAYEMMLSESQERMLMVLRPEKEAEARAIFEKWDLDFAVVGETIPEDRFLILHGNEVKADLPLSKLSSEAPEYDRPWVETPPPAAHWAMPAHRSDRRAAALIGSPNHAHKGWVWEQYDHMVMGDTVRAPGLGAGVVRVHGTDKALAFTSDVTPRYVAPTPTRAASRPWPRPSATSAPWAPGRWPRPTT